LILIELQESVIFLGKAMWTQRGVASWIIRRLRLIVKRMICEKVARRFRISLRAPSPLDSALYIHPQILLNVMFFLEAVMWTFEPRHRLDDSPS